MRSSILGLVVVAACSASKAPAPASSPEPPDAGAPAADDGEAERPGLTAEACEARGGTVVGDIGDGAIHRSEYRCPDSGEPPIGSIVADADGPMAVEGAVCCQ